MPGIAEYEIPRDLRDQREIGDVDRRSEGAPTRVGDHEAIALELLQRLPHRSPTRAEVLRQCVVTERFTRPDVEHDETVPDRFVCPVAEGRRMSAASAGRLRSNAHAPYFR